MIPGTLVPPGATSSLDPGSTFSLFWLTVTRSWGRVLSGRSHIVSIFRTATKFEMRFDHGLELRVGTRLTTLSNILVVKREQLLQAVVFLALTSEERLKNVLGGQFFESNVHGFPIVQEGTCIIASELHVDDVLKVQTTFEHGIVFFGDALFLDAYLPPKFSMEDLPESVG